jgi:hypothetical protein
MQTQQVKSGDNMSYKVRVTGIKHLYSRNEGVYLCTIFGGGLANLPNLTDMYEPQEVVIEEDADLPEVKEETSFPQYEPSPSPINDGYNGNYEEPKYPNPMIHP